MLHSHLAAAGYVVTERDERVLTGAPELIVTPNYWKPRAQDWRQWRLSPAQRINRMWGMEAVSKKDRLVHPLERRYGVGLCPRLIQVDRTAHSLSAVQVERHDSAAIVRAD